MTRLKVLLFGKNHIKFTKEFVSEDARAGAEQ